MTTMTKRSLVWTALALTVFLSACQQLKPQYGYRCTYRAIESGNCDTLNAPAPDADREPL